MSSTKRVNSYRSSLKSSKIKTIEVQLNLDEVAILDALSLRNGCSRVLYVSTLLKKVIYSSGFFISGGNLYNSKHDF